jgi:Zn-dependent protease with chaperone function
MKKIYIICSFASLLLLTVPLPYQLTNNLVEQFGNQPLKPRHQKYVKSIMCKMNMDQDIIMRKSNWLAKITWGRNNAMAIYDTYLYLSDGFFDELSKSEQRFLIGHELSHIKFKHNSKSLALLLILIMIMAFIFSYLNAIIKQRVSHKLIRLTLNGAIIVMLLFGKQAIQAAYSRQCEKQADQESARCLNCSYGGIQFMERFDTMPSVEKKTLYQEFISPWFATHPHYAARREYIKNLH